MSTINTRSKETLDLRKKSIQTKEQEVLLDQIALKLPMEKLLNKNKYVTRDIKQDN